jgi:hypothetical protein
MPTRTESRNETGHEMTTSPVQSITSVKPVIDHAFARRNRAATAQFDAAFQEIDQKEAVGG